MGARGQGIQIRGHQGQDQAAGLHGIITRGQGLSVHRRAGKVRDGLLVIHAALEDQHRVLPAADGVLVHGCRCLHGGVDDLLPDRDGHADRLRIRMVAVSNRLVPDVVGSGFGSCRDGCGIKVFCRNCGGVFTKGVLHFATLGFASHIHKRFTRSVVSTIVCSNRSCHSTCLVDRHLN